jgi:predicted DNA-binding protein
MLTLHLSAEVQDLLNTLAGETGRTPEEIAYRALLDVLEDHEDAKIADERIRTSDGTTIPWEDIKNQYFDEEGLPK